MEDIKAYINELIAAHNTHFQKAIKSTWKAKPVKEVKLTKYGIPRRTKLDNIKDRYFQTNMIWFKLKEDNFIYFYAVGNRRIKYAKLDPDTKWDIDIYNDKWSKEPKLIEHYHFDNLIDMFDKIYKTINEEDFQDAKNV